MRMTVDVSDGMIPVAALGLELNGLTAALKCENAQSWQA
jgi:hypothetical protein